MTTRLLKGESKLTRQVDEGDFALPDSKTMERLNELATAKLSEIVRRSTAQERGWRGYDKLEVAAARELLSDEASAVSGIER